MYSITFFFFFNPSLIEHELKYLKNIQWTRKFRNAIMLPLIYYSKFNSNFDHDLNKLLESFSPISKKISATQLCRVGQKIKNTNTELNWIKTKKIENMFKLSLNSSQTTLDSWKLHEIQAFCKLLFVIDNLIFITINWIKKTRIDDKSFELF